MSRQALIYALSFGFSTCAAIIYSFIADELSLHVITVLFSAVVYLSYVSTTLLDVEATLGRFRGISDDLQGQRRATVWAMLDTLHRPSARVIHDQVSLVNEVGRAIRENTRFGSGAAVFVGAVSLQTPSEDTDARASALIYEDDEEQSPFQIYQGILEEAASRNATIVRFVSLPKREELQGRSTKWANDYARWLENQISQINRNASFFLVDSPRCPRWGSAGARILVGENIFDITRKGGGTMQIRDERIATLQSEKVVQSALAGDRSNVTVYSSDKQLAEARFPGVNIHDEDEYKVFIEGIRNEIRSRRS